MNKKIIISLATIAVVAVAAIGGTIAYFSSTQTSEDNIIKAGTIDLQLDHTKQTYNGVDCKTCSVTVFSDTSDQVVGTIGGSDLGPFPHISALVDPVNSAWTANIPEAQWIWWTNPTPEGEKGIDTIYTFEKTFNWMGPITDATLALGIGADNSYEVYLNNQFVGGDVEEQNYNAAGQDTYTGTAISNWIVQGTNTLQFKVKNWARPVGQTWDNPGGLIYKLTIDGNCEDSSFAETCKLWQTGDFTNQKFFNFNDVKPGDWGTNVISLHVTSNDAHVCMYVPNYESDPVDAPLADYIHFSLWNDEDQDGVQDGGEVAIPTTDSTLAGLKADLEEIAGGDTKYLGVKWCFGEIIGDSCNGEGANDNGYNSAQGNELLADLGFYAVQTRHNDNGFACPNTMPEN